MTEGAADVAGVLVIGGIEVLFGLGHNGEFQMVKNLVNN